MNTGVILLNVADEQQTKQEASKQFEKVVDKKEAKCYIGKAASLRSE